MTWLLDVNVLIAALVAAHEHHGRVSSWLASLAAAARVAKLDNGIPGAIVIPE